MREVVWLAWVFACEHAPTGVCSAVERGLDHGCGVRLKAWGWLNTAGSPPPGLLEYVSRRFSRGCAPTTGYEAPRSGAFTLRACPAVWSSFAISQNP